jgi:hypothetical protein
VHVQKLSDLTRKVHASKTATWVRIALLPLSWVALYATVVYADDCGRDISRAEDCLRTDNTAAKIAATAATIVAVLVNGHTIIRTIITNPVEIEEGQEPPPPKYYTLQVRSVNGQGAQSTTINLQLDEPVYVQAWIEASGEGATPADGGPIQIDLQQGGEYVTLSEGPAIPDGRSVVLQGVADPPAAPPQQPALVVVSAPLGGQPFSAPVTLGVIGSGYELEVS